MNKVEILDTLKSLARSQGSYGRIVAAIESDPDAGNVFLSHLADRGFNDPVDLILFLEG